MQVRRQLIPTLGGLLLIGLLTGCVDAPSAAPGDAPTSLAPGNESTAKGEPAEVPPAEAILVVAALEDDGSAISASGYVAGVIENDGRCTFEFVGPSVTRSVESDGLADVSTTSCGNVQLPASQLSSGSWSVSFRYVSTSTPELVSAPQIVEVP